MRRSLDVSLMLVLFLCFSALFLCHEDPFARNYLASYLGLNHVNLTQYKSFFKIIYDLAAGSLITIIFYYLVVRLPDYQRRQKLKAELVFYYRIFRLDCIHTILGYANKIYPAELPERLLDQEMFKNYFKEKVSPSEERWHSFLNNIDEHGIRDLQNYMEIFRDELDFVLNNTEIPDEDVFKFVRRLKRAIYSIKECTNEYDEIKPLSNFLWQLLAGWDPISGYRSEDIISKMINLI